ncbi:3-oxoacyl-[acyl-carrier-protein] synthase-3 [Pullulanibacillus pueri]|uniref:3-oxoacyl-ACP synthase n=1 Tax=Pullulanibacillus pueri TaxID=1437324 RepID=A0A8J2ZX31_9BACL|nr:ketoacyl-ACP synthase III [Pullulanibacillus pueri]MBM7683876.1 3-oxoacyl-[acyl-carrier-protein] synthase-3 [Pullulanibacillus pueri]GGH84635.1 3-oxoacyl-ACP synthase [Pullulanibacillus pueri]
MEHIKIRDIAIYHPETIRDNEFYLQHFKKQGRDITKFLDKVLGRKQRFVIENNEENSLTMAVESSKRVLEKAQLTGKDLDLIVFSSQTPEYLATTNALQLHRALQASTKTITMDSNANCAGMTLAIDQAARYMLSNPRINTVLIVGSDYNTLMSNPEEEITYANFGDASCAVILEKTDEDTGFIDSIYFTDSSTYDKTYFPRHGLSKMFNHENKGIQWLPFDGDIALPPAYEMIETLLKRNNKGTEDIGAFCLSQFSISNIERIQEHFSIADEKIMYIGDRFGYTGTSSPFIALHEGIEAGRIKRGDTVLFWTIGGGYQMVAMLLTY